MRNSVSSLLSAVSLILFVTSGHAQYYQGSYYYNDQYGGAPDSGDNRQSSYYGHGSGRQQRPQNGSQANLHYDERDAEMILRDQLSRTGDYDGMQGSRSADTQMYDNPYGHRIHDEGQVRNVMSEARSIANLIRQRNAKPFVVIDKRNFQFYLYGTNGKLLRIGPVAIGKGKTEVGAFETPVGIFPIKAKVPVDDWVRPDWYFIEEGEPIPRRWEDRRVPGFFRYKLVYDGARYIHYAEATGGRLTHGCLGLDWHDAEAVFHTLEVGSYCIIVDQAFLGRLARGEFPVQKPPAAKPAKPEEPTPTIVIKEDQRTKRSDIANTGGAGNERILRTLW